MEYRGRIIIEKGQVNNQGYAIDPKGVSTDTVTGYVPLYQNGTEIGAANIRHWGHCVAANLEFEEFYEDFGNLYPSVRGWVNEKEDLGDGVQLVTKFTLTGVSLDFMPNSDRTIGTINEQEGKN